MTDRPDVLFLVLDSMRIDRLSHYGHDQATTPNLDELTETATVYENAITPTPWTLPTHCSLFTGRFPSQHGVTNGIPNRSITLPDALETLPERLSDDGYRTGAFVNNPWVGQTSGLDRGFDEYVEWDLEILHESDDVEYTRADRFCSRFHRYIGHTVRHPAYLLKRPFFTSRLIELSRRWIGTNSSDPRFTFMNLMEAHSPYFPPDSAFEHLGLESPGLFESRLLNTKLLGYLRGSVDPNAIRPRIMEYYDASLHFQDRKVGELLDHLRNNGQFDETLIVICSDHGKTLGEYDRDGEPSHYLRDINTDVPLLVKYPGQQSGERVEQPVELTNVASFLADGGEEPFESYQPMADVAHFEDHIPHTSDDVESVERWRGLITVDHKYLRRENGTEFLLIRGADSETLMSNPDEETISDLRERLEHRVGSLNEGAEGGEGDRLNDLDDRTKDHLKDLGYMG